MSPLPVPPHANSVLATATATGREKSGEPAPAGAWPISMRAAGPPANALRERHSVRLARAVLTGYQAHYNMARPHQGIAQRVPARKHDSGHLTVADLDRGRILRKPVLGGLINEYARAA